MCSFNYCLVLFLATVSAIAYAIDLYFNFAFSNGQYTNHSSRTVSEKYTTQITPANWVFQIWIVIYALLAVWYIYVFYLLLCRRLHRDSSPLFPGIFWLLFTIVHALNALWLYFFLHNGFIVSGVILIVLTLLLYLLNMIAYRVCWMDVAFVNANNNRDIEREDEDIVVLSHCEIILLRLLTLNGLPMYAMWCTIATCLQWASIFKYFTFHWSDNVSCIVSLSVLSMLLLLYWNLDLMMARKYFVYTWFSCFTLVIGLTAIIDRYNSFGGSRRPGLFYVFVLLIISVFVIVIKVFTLCLCPPKYYNPRFSRV